MEFDNNFKAHLGLTTNNFVPAVARYSSMNNSYKEGVVILHRGSSNTDNCIVMIASKGAVCTTGFDVISYCSKTPSDDLAVLDAQLYSISGFTGVKILFEFVGQNKIAVLSGIRNSLFDGWNNYDGDPTYTKISLISKS